MIIEYISIYELILYSYFCGVIGGLSIVAFIIYRYRRKKHDIQYRFSIGNTGFSIRRYVNNIYKRLVK